MILKIDESRRNIVVSRRKLIEITREQQKKQLLAEIEVGQVRKGTVKNIADFGAFVDLGGIDGLLHITDMSWGRINHPSDMVKIDDQIEVMVLHVDKDREKIALGLKQKSRQPLGERRRQVPGRHARQGRGRQRDELRRLRQARRGDRGPGPHQRDVLDQADQPSQRAGPHRRQDRGRRPGHQQGEAGNLAGHEADPDQPLGPGRRQVPARHDGRGDRPQPDQLRRLHRDRGGDRRPAAHLRHVLDPQDQPSQRGARKGPAHQLPGAQRRSGAQADRPGPQAARAKTPGRPTSPAGTSRATSSRARSPS